MRNSGKSSIGKFISSHLSYTHIDLDYIFESKYESIDSFVSNNNWESFRENEKEILTSELEEVMRE
jgi:shikimate kinase